MKNANHTRGRTIFNVLLVHLLLPLLLLVSLLLQSSSDYLTWVLYLLVVGSYIVFIDVAGSWSWLGRIVRFSLPVLFVIVAVISRPSSASGSDKLAPLLNATIFALGVAIIFTVRLIVAFRRRTLNSPPLELRFPFREGAYFVAQGGSRLIVNNHGKSFSQRYALDIVKLNSIGVRAWGLYPTDPKRYAMFGAEVISPCDGVVAAAVDGLPDMLVPERDPEHRAGNYVAIESMGSTIYLAHLLKGSICVRQGDLIQAGQVLGRVGNSGNTTEPHLHTHAEEGTYPGKFSGNRGIPVKFNGRFLVRNDVVHIPL